MKKTFLLLLIGVLFLIPRGVSATYLVSYHSYGVTEEEKQLMDEEKQEKRNIFQELEYRMIEKDTRDAVDYLILFVLFGMMVMVIIALNKKPYVIPGNTNIFLEEPKVPLDNQVKIEKEEVNK